MLVVLGCKCRRGLKRDIPRLSALLEDDDATLEVEASLIVILVTVPGVVTAAIVGAPGVTSDVVVTVPPIFVSTSTLFSYDEINLAKLSLLPSVSSIIFLCVVEYDSTMLLLCLCL